MPRCPNCGRETQRTEDWACQWCGHPLLSNAFKKIPKTYRELQEERSLNVSLTPEEEPEPAPAAEAEVEAEPAPPTPEPAPEPTPKPLETEAEPEAEPAKEPVAEAEPEAPPQPEPDAAVEAEEEVEKEPQPPTELEPEAIESSEPVKEPEPAQVAEAETEPAPEPEPQPQPEAEPAKEPVAEAVPEAAVPPQAPVAAPALETDPATGTINVTVEELDAAFNSNKAGTNAKLVDKLLRVSGPVQKIFAKDNLDIFYIILASAGKASNWQVRCTFSREHGAYLSRLTEGQEQTVQGTYVGYERNIILKECSLVQ